MGYVAALLFWEKKCFNVRGFLSKEKDSIILPKLQVAGNI